MLLQRSDNPSYSIHSKIWHFLILHNEDRIKEGVWLASLFTSKTRQPSHLHFGNPAISETYDAKSQKPAPTGPQTRGFPSHSHEWFGFVNILIVAREKSVSRKIELLICDTNQQNQGRGTASVDGVDLGANGLCSTFPLKTTPRVIISNHFGSF